MNDPVSINLVDGDAGLDYRIPTLSVDRRVADLLKRMTLEEKVAQMICIWGQRKTILFDPSGKLDAKSISRHLPHGIGQIARLSDKDGGLDAREMAELANEIQRYFVEETRLGIPVIFHEECLHGLVAKEAASYPQPIGLASTFDPSLVEEIYSAIAEDMRSRGAHQALTPVLDVARDPRWGRVEETFGEDPYLVTQMGIAAVRGFQGDGNLRTNNGVIATLKHFAAHGQPESGMNCAPVNVSERLLRDTFLAPFRDVIAGAAPFSVMASYNEIDGLPSHANEWLLRDVLRNEWGFTGYVVSDYYAITELHRRDETASHGIAADKDEAALLAANAGVNIEFPDPDCYPGLLRLIEAGRLDESVIDELVGRMLKFKFELGLFDDPYVDPGAAHQGQGAGAEKLLAQRAARETAVLLKNEGGILPLDLAKLSSVAVIGPNADRKLLGGYSGEPPYFVSVLQGIREKAGQNVRVLYSEGCRLTVGGSWSDDPVTFADPETNRRLIQEAVSTAVQADAVILALGENEQISREAWNRFHMGDRADLRLIGMQADLLNAVAATGKPVVVVLINGRPIALTDVQDQIPAVLECWYLGQETGHAVADILFGDCTPGGKLPISIPRSAGHIPSYYNYKPSARRGYLDDDVAPLYPFGFGLSYTTFSISNVKLGTPVVRRDECTVVRADVRNTGAREGDEVVQMYIRDRVSSITRPVKELKGFRRIRLKAGETKTVELPIRPEHLAFTDLHMRHVVEPGEFEIMIGTSSDDRDLQKVILTVER